MDATLSPLLSMMELHTRLLHNCLDGVSDEMAVRRGPGGTNHMAFLALHLVESRWYLVGFAGGEPRNPFAALLHGVRSVDDLREVPPLDDVRVAWDAAGEAVEAALRALPSEALSAPSPQPLPGPDPSLLGAFAFLASHEAYHVGQLALLRREMGLPAMRYD
jgi:uncharacterized damage-inducible protein DinB